MRDLPYWLALNRISVLGARRFRRLLEAFGSAEKALEAGVDELVSAGLPAKAAAAMVQERDALDPGETVEQLKRLGIRAMILPDSAYPALLKQIYDPPPVLYYRGDPAVLAAPCMALVGSRKATQYGRAAAYRLGAELAAMGVTVVSGMARGIDTAAHQGALNSGSTAAVLGCGPDICYPPENKQLRDKIAEKGILISEFPPGTQPKPPHFPMRNRIISGLCLTVTVVEAAERSGALITADCALEQGREVLAVPGSIQSPASRGCHRLLKEGAAVAEHGVDILRAAGLAFEPVAAGKAAETTGEQERVLAAMEYEPAHFDEIMARSGLTVSRLAALLVELELAGFIRKMPGNFFLRV
jgi:DNA processing protein